MVSVLLLVLLWHSITGETGCKLDLRGHEGGPLEGCLMFSTTPVGVDLSKLEESRSRVVD